MKVSFSNQQGFSLVEVLVALALLSLISVYGLSALYFARAYNRVGQNIERELNEQAAFERLREVFSQLQFGSQDLIESPSFIGRSDRLKFLALSDGKTMPGGLYQAELFKNTDGHLAFLLKSWPVNDGKVTPDEVIAFSEVGEVRFGYAANSSSNTFTDTWESKDTYPHAVRLEFTDRKSDTAATQADVNRTIMIGPGY